MKPHKLDRVYHQYNRWEELQYGMWADPVNKKEQEIMAINLMSNDKLFGHYMKRVTNEWPISCENALTDENLNKKAWLGQAACALAMRIPESVTRSAWSKLTYEQQFLANKQAEQFIFAWSDRYAASSGLSENMERSLL